MRTTVKQQAQVAFTAYAQIKCYPSISLIRKRFTWFPASPKTAHWVRLLTEMLPSLDPREVLPSEAAKVGMRAQYSGATQAGLPNFRIFTVDGEWIGSVTWNRHTRQFTYKTDSVNGLTRSAQVAIQMIAG